MPDQKSPFNDCELSPEAILGEQTYPNVLFTSDAETPVNIRTGDTPDHSRATVAEAKAFAASIDSETPQIALSRSVEAQIETHGKPYSAAAFFHFKATGSLERHRAYHAAYNSSAFDVNFDADYNTGTLTITVTQSNAE